MKRILIGATLIVAGVIGVAGASPVSAANANTGVCQPQTAHEKPDNETTKSITVTADPGQLITGYCVKAGSANQGLGPEYKYFNPPVPSVTITHSSGKDISHYIVFYTNAEEEGRVKVTPVKPESTGPTCEAAGTVEVLTDTDAYTYNYAQNSPVGSTTVTVTAKEGYSLIGDKGPWTYPIAQLTGEQCEDDPEVESNPPPETPPTAVVPPAAPTDRPPVLTEAVASAGPAPAQAAPAAAPAQAAPTQLPATGTASWALALIAMGLVLLGSGFVGFSRRLS